MNLIMWYSAVTQRYRIILNQLSSNVLYELYWAYHKHWWSACIIKQLIARWSIYPIWLFQTVVLSNEFLKQVIKRIFTSTLIWLVCLALKRIRPLAEKEKSIINFCSSSILILTILSAVYDFQQGLLPACALLELFHVLKLRVIHFKSSIKIDVSKESKKYSYSTQGKLKGKYCS